MIRVAPTPGRAVNTYPPRLGTPDHHSGGRSQPNALIVAGQEFCLIQKFVQGFDASAGLEDDDLDEEDFDDDE